MENLKVSIVIPAYNIEKYLPICLDSVISQTYKNIEIVVVNDGSKDETGRIIDEYAAKDGRIIPIHKENGGVSSARLAGIKAASGDFIGFVDGDDSIEPDMYERLLSNAVKHNADISHCGYKMVFPKGHIDYYYNTGKLLVQDNSTGLKDLIEGRFIEPGLVNKLYSKNIIKSFIENGEMDYSVKINEDLLMNYYLFKAAETSVYEDFCPYHYTLRAGSASVSKKEHHVTDAIKVRKLIFEDVGDNTSLSGVAFSVYVRCLMWGCCYKEFPHVVKNCHAELKKMLKKKELVKNFSRSLRIMAGIAAVSPNMYRVFRKTTNRLRGLDKKYSLDK